MWMKKLPLTVSKKTYLIVEVLLVCFVVIVTTLGLHYFGVIYGLLVGVLCSPILPIRTYIIRVPDHVSLTKEEFDSLEHKHEDILYVIREKKPKE